jgi:hypothetical protein
VIFEIPLDQGFCEVFTWSRSGERTPTGAVRMEFRLDPCRSRGTAESEHGQCSRPPRTGLSDPFGASTATTSRRTPRETGAGVGSDRAHGHLRVVESDGDLLERSSEARKLAVGERDGEANEFDGHLRVVGGRGSRGVEPKDLGPPQLDPARSVPIGTRTEGSGNRVSVNRCQRVRDRATGVESERAIARHAARRDGRCEQVESKATARRSTSGGPVHRAAPEGALARAGCADRGAFVFPLAPVADTPQPEIRSQRGAQRNVRAEFSGRDGVRGRGGEAGRVSAGRRRGG